MNARAGDPLPFEPAQGDRLSVTDCEQIPRRAFAMTTFHQRRPGAHLQYEDAGSRFVLEMGAGASFADPV